MIYDTEYPSDLLDAYCMEQFGHTDWEQKPSDDGSIIIVFHKPQLKESNYD
jgi:hypothetical protein